VTEDITSHVLAQIRQDIARVDSRVTALSERVERIEAGLADLRDEVRRGFAHLGEQLGSIVALMGVLAKNDERLELRIEAIETRLAST
jgi:chaperonin cofactor prefoldin